MRSSQDTYTLANGVKMPCIGLGTYQSPDAVASAAVKDAMAAGYRLIDTAAAYGNERGVGQGIRISGVPTRRSSSPASCATPRTAIRRRLRRST